MKKSNRYQRLRQDTGHHRRIMAAAALLGLVAFLPVAVRLYDLMITNHNYYGSLALKNQTRTTYVTGTRGTIYDRNMNILARDETVENVYLNPQELRQSGADLEELSQRLGAILDRDPQWIREQAGDLKLRYKQVAARVEPETASQIRAYIHEADIRGIHLEPNTRRYYPYGALASQVVGFTNSSADGCEGIEASYDRYLSGSAGRVITSKGGNEMDMPYSYEGYVASQAGCSLVLTLDMTVQACLEKQMQAAIDRYDVQNGAFGMVMNAKTGEILAMATLGGYDPNQYLEVYDTGEAQRLQELKDRLLLFPEGSGEMNQAREEYTQALQAARLKQWRNRCISDGYEPGSTFKVMTMAAALDCGAINLNTNFYCRGSEKIPGRSQLLHCWRSAGHGSEQTPQALQNSCNIAFAHIALALGGQRFYDYVKAFGVLEPTGIDLAGESKGVFFDKSLVVNTEKWGTASLTSGSFGQTFKLTPLQLVRAVAAVVNGGTLLEPYIVSQVTDHTGRVILQQEPTVLRQVISPETSRTMRQLMQSVVEEGTAKNAAVAGFAVGGKTGTSEKIDVFDENGQRVQDKIVSFIGVAPMDDPEYIVLVALDTPSRKTGIYISGGVMAAPTVGAVLGDILPYLGVHRTENDPASQLQILPDLTGMTPKEALKALKDAGFTALTVGTGPEVLAQIPGPGQELPGGSQVLLYLEQEPEERLVEVPDFTGLDRQKASDSAGALGLYILAAGNPEASPQITVISQSIAPGTMVPVGTTIEVTFVDKTLRD